MDDHEDFDEQAYEDDLAAQNAVEDAKYDYPPQEEPDDWHQGDPTHYQLAEEGISALDNVEFGTGQLAEELALIQAHATLAMADQLADVLSLLKQERGRQSFAERLADEAMARLDAIDGRRTAAAGRDDEREALELWELRVPGRQPRFYQDHRAAQLVAMEEHAQAHPGVGALWFTHSGGEGWTYRAPNSGSNLGWDVYRHVFQQRDTVPEEGVDDVVRVGSLSPTGDMTSTALAAWLRRVPLGSSLTDVDGDRWYRITVAAADPDAGPTYPAIARAESDVVDNIDDRDDMIHAFRFAPFTVLALGTQDGA